MRPVNRVMLIYPPVTFSPQCVKQSQVPLGIAYIAAVIRDQVEGVDYFEAHFDTPEWTMDEIHEIRRRWFWRYNFSLLIRHPIRFISRYLEFLSKPRQAFDIFKRRLRS